MDNKKRLEEMLSYGMSEEGLQKILNDIEVALTESIEAITSYQDVVSNYKTINPNCSEWEERLNKTSEEATVNIKDDLKEITDLYNRVMDDWKELKKEKNMLDNNENEVIDVDSNEESNGEE